MSFKDIRANDIKVSMVDVGIPVEYNGYNTYGILLLEPTDVLALNSKTYAVQDTVQTLTIATNSLGILKISKASGNELIMVDNIQFKIDKYISISDVETKIWLSGIQS